MKNKKFLKALATFMLSGAAALGCFAMFGCAHSHTYSSDWVNTDPDKHWHQATCEHKDERADEEEHKYDDNGKCTVCEYQKPQAPKHTHTPSTDWKTDENDHWKECTATDCDNKGVKLEKATHTKNEDGTECIICHKEFEVGGEDDPAAALAKAKTDAKAELAAYKKASDYTTNATALEEAISAGNTAIDAAKTTAEVATALADAKTAIDAIKSDAKLEEEATAAAAAALAKAKEDAKAELTAYKKAEDYTTNADALEKAISDGNTAIDAATTTEGVATALAAAKAEIDKIKSDAELGGEEASYTVTFDMHNIGTAPAAQTVNKDGYATQPTAPTATGYYFVGWYTDESYATEFDFENTAITKTTTVYACWSEDIKSTVTIPTVTSNTTITGSETIGKVTFVGGRWESGNRYNTGGGSPYIEFELTGSTNSVSFSSWGASSGGSVISFVKVENGTETAVETYASVGNNVYLPGCTADSPLTIGNLSAGTYRLKGSASFRTNNISISERLVVSDPDSIKVTPSVVDFVIGSEFSSEGLGTVLHYKNGREDVITNVSIDKSAYKKDVPGKYPVTVSYTLAGSTTPFTATYHVYVYGVDSISLKTNATKQDGNTPAGNQAYVNHTAQQVYFKGDKLNLDGYTVHLNSSVTVEGEEKKEKLFLYTPTATDFTGFDSTEAGVQTVTLHAYDLSVEFDVLVMETPDLSEASFIGVIVSQRLDNAEVKAIVKQQLGLGEDDEIEVGKYYAEQNACCFETIQQALDFLELSNLKATAKKMIILDAGVYREKLEITIPNLEIGGSDLTKLGPDAGPNDGEEVRIEWDSLYGVADESGYVQTTDSTATLNVRASAEGFRIANVTISNYYNCEENFKEALGIGYSEHRALAMLIQADKVGIQHCKILGYQDTIELFTGRQVIYDTYISGTTDFIFGTNNTTYFQGCTIHSIKRWKKTLDADGNPVLETDGGYITAFKGNNKGDADYVQYGAIFDGCTFTADEGVADGKTAIGRPWGKYAAVAVINSELGKHIATTSTGEASKNERYVTMSGNKPTESTVKFVEYNNTGAGAITEEVAGMKLLSESQASNYKDFSIIFGKKNGGLTYADAWSGSFEIVTVTITLGDKSEKIYGYHGGTISQAVIDEAVAKLIGEGKELDTLTYGANQAFSADTVLQNDILGATNELEVTATEKDKDNTVQTETFNASSDGYATGTSLKSKQYTGTSFTLVAGGAGDTKSSAVGMTATANDESGLKFNNAFVPGGSGRTYTVTAVKNVKITIYYTVSNGDISTATTAFTKGGELTVDGTAVTSLGNKSNDVAYAYTLELKAGASAVIGTDNTSNRLVLFGVVAEY